jgi:isocitrate dehydrogenase kinase/phosphatase
VERRLTPLNLFVREAPPEAARAAVLDYGRAIRDLAATNIFPGDILLKNFGVTRHSRVVFYDYDELAQVTDCNFRDLPQARSLEDEMGAEPWFFVGDNDIFPAEFVHFLGLPEPLRTHFLESHAEVLTASFWRGLQERLRGGEIVDIFPYSRPDRLTRL